jgi:hypothetical protein
VGSLRVLPNLGLGERLELDIRLGAGESPDLDVFLWLPPPPRMGTMTRLGLIVEFWLCRTSTNL